MVVVSLQKPQVLCVLVLHWTSHMSCKGLCSYTADAYPVPRLANDLCYYIR